MSSVTVGRLAALAFGGLLAAAGNVAGQHAEREPASPVLVAYGFEDEVPTGPDTIRVIANARGRVSISHDFAYAGYAAVELTEQPGDHDFPELQGFFPLTRSGHLVLRFALLVVDPREELNIALAGPGGFAFAEDGIAFWLSTRDGWLFHTSDSIPKRLLALDPFTWYRVDADLDVAAGRYDLTVTREQEMLPLVALRRQANAGSRPGSAVNVLSFIGDNGDDLSRVAYYVDEVVLARERPLSLSGFVAPGRRRFFVDLLERGESAPKALARCLPLADLADLGYNAGALERIEVAGGLPALSALLARDQAAFGPALRNASDQATLIRELAPLVAYNSGCADLDRGTWAAAERMFETGLRTAPAAVGLLFGRGLALAALGRPAAREILDSLSGREGDPRYALLAAAVLAGDADPGQALASLDGHRADAIQDGRATPVADGTYFLLRAADEPRAAYDFAREVIAALPVGSEQRGRWQERAGLAAFALRDLDAAEAAFQAAAVAYQQSPDARAAGQRLALARADLAWLRGDLAAERALREAIYGRLTSATNSP